MLLSRISIPMPSRKAKPKNVAVPAPKEQKGQLINPGAYKVPKSEARPYSIENPIPDRKRG